MNVVSVFTSVYRREVSGNDSPSLFELLWSAGATATHPLLIVRNFALAVALIEELAVDSPAGRVEPIARLTGNPCADAPLVKVNLRYSVSFQKLASQFGIVRLAELRDSPAGTIDARGSIPTHISHTQYVRNLS